MSKINKPVGKVPTSTKQYYNGSNEVGDVLTVSSLLNLHWAHAQELQDEIDCPVPSGQMNPELEEAIRAFQETIVRIPPDGWISPAGKTIMYLENKLGQGPATKASSPTVQGQKIVDEARKILGDRPVGGRVQDRAGAHWTSGSTGARLGTAGLDLRNIHLKGLDDSNLDDPSVNGCKNHVDTCWGRPDVASLGSKRLKRSDVKAYLDFMNASGLPRVKWIGINIFLAEDIENKAKLRKSGTLEQFLEEQFRKSPLRHLYPVRSDRVFKLRESCYGRLHFDCIGLVSWCYSTVLGKKWRFAPSQITKDTGFSKMPLDADAKAELKELKDKGKKQPRLAGPLHDGDILYKLKPGSSGFHLGIYTSKGTLIHGPGYRVGIVENTYDPKTNKQKFQFAARLRKLK